MRQRWFCLSSWSSLPFYGLQHNNFFESILVLSFAFASSWRGWHTMGLFHIHTNHSINTRAHPTPPRLGKVYKRPLVVPPSFPHQRAFVCGACIGTAQVGVSLVSLFNPLFKQSRCIVSMYVWRDICDTWKYDDNTDTVCVVLFN